MSHVHAPRRQRHRRTNSTTSLLDAFDSEQLDFDSANNVDSDNNDLIATAKKSLDTNVYTSLNKRLAIGGEAALTDQEKALLAYLHETIKEDKTDEPKKTKIKWWWPLLGAFAIAQGLGAGANNATAFMRAIPSVANNVGMFSWALTQVLVTSLFITGAAMNAIIMWRLMPGTVKQVAHFFKNIKQEWQKSKTKCIAKITAIFGALCAGVAVGAFTYISAPVTIMGMLTLLSLSPAGWPLVGIAVFLAVIQALAIACLVLKDSLGLIESCPKLHPGNLFKASWWKAKGQWLKSKCWPNQQDIRNNPHVNSCTQSRQRKALQLAKAIREYQRAENNYNQFQNTGSLWSKLKHHHLKKLRDIAKHRVIKTKRIHDDAYDSNHQPNCLCHNVAYRRASMIGRAIAFTLGIAILVGAAIFFTWVEGEAFMGLLSNWHQGVATALTVGIVYIASGILNAILNAAAADSVFGKIGHKLGVGAYHLFGHPINTVKKGWYWLKTNVSEMVNFAKENPLKAVGNVLWYGCIVGAVISLLVTLIGNTLGNAAISTHIPIDNSHSQTAAAVKESLNPDKLNTTYFKELLTTPQNSHLHPLQIASGAAGGVVSASLISHVMMSGGKTDMDRQVERNTKNPHSLFNSRRSSPVADPGSDSNEPTNYSSSPTLPYGPADATANRTLRRTASEPLLSK